ncbi:MAG TPA: lipase maturation factor family protein [Bryobacteraceae bacterium]|nr:lipase maturation factor family protein [Bryobacteraceae bacterium]
MTGQKPVLIYDGRCSFCKIWIDYWKQLTGERIEYRASQDLEGAFPEIPRQQFSKSLVFVRGDGSFAAGARAVFESLGMRATYERNRVFAWLSERFYSIVAAHRDFFYWATRLTFGTRIRPTSFAATQWIFLRALAAIYAIAFGSLGVQIKGLVGEHGISPAAQYLQAVAQQTGPEHWYILPTIFWWDSTDRMLVFACWAGVAFAALLFFGYLEKLMLIFLFALYLSLSSAGQEFLGYQWDALLLETGFLAIFLGRATIVDWLFRWLVFRLNFLSGSVKLLSGDPTWHHLTAMDYHYHTQPLPTVLAWFADKLPHGLQSFSTFMVLAIELGAPFLIFMPRRLRLTGAWSIIGLQVMILLTGNYTFFNWLTIALCLFLFDDRSLARFAPRRVIERVRPKMGRWARAGIAIFAGFIVLLGVGRIIEAFTGDAPEPLKLLVRVTSPLEIVNSYGLFAVMTTTRPEIIVEGSRDGENWEPYMFRYKPGPLNRAPGWIAPFQPRLDWQMWFAALGTYRQNVWFVSFAARLLEGSKDVEALLARNPFPDRPPRYIRAMVYEYSFTDWATLRRTGDWWKREPLGAYLPPIGLRANAALLPASSLN